MNKALTSGLMAGAIAAVIYLAISSVFMRGVTRWGLWGAVVIGVSTVVITFVISSIIARSKAAK